MYGLKIENFSYIELNKIFTKHIDKNAKITTYLWKIKEYNITQIKSNNGDNFIALHIIIHQFKS